MSEWRKDPIIDRWVVISNERGKRPFDYNINEVKKNQGCPFCEGNEYKTPPEIIAYRKKDSIKDRPGWRIRVVPNKYPALNSHSYNSKRRCGFFKSMEGIGVQEVIVESTIHESGLDRQTEEQVAEVIWVWRDRLLDLRRDARIKYIQIFKNSGYAAGASLEHTHSQIIAIPMVPLEIRQEIEGAKKHLKQHGRCIFCDLQEQEITAQERVVINSSYFLSFAPFASRFPFEIWIIPKKHQHDFIQIREEQEVKELAAIIKKTLRKILAAIPNSPYNIVLHTAPINLPEDVIFHWHIEIMPRFTLIAGFELGTGYYINPLSPEIAARILREKK